MNELVVTCPDEAATLQVAEKIASMVKGGGVIELVGDVGSGKTTFVKGLAKGLGYDGQVSSPSFVLKNVYKAKEVTINHFDLYRLARPGIVKHELVDALADKNTVMVIEWGQSAKDILPDKRITVSFSATDDNSRKLKITLPEE